MPASVFASVIERFAILKMKVALEQQWLRYRRNKKVVKLMGDGKDTGSVTGQACDSLLVTALMSQNAELVKQPLKCLDNNKIVLHHFDEIKS